MRVAGEGTAYFMTTSALDIAPELFDGEQADRSVVSKACDDSRRAIWLFAFDCMR